MLEGFELRFDLAGRAAVRVAGGPVAPRHVEPVPPVAPWVIEARCGAAAGWLLAPVAPEDPAAAQALLQAAVDRRTALALQALIRQAAVSGADALERLTHRLRTDVMTLHTVADAALKGQFGAAETAEVAAEMGRTAREAQRQLTEARALLARAATEPIVETLRAELEAAGRAGTVSGPSERALTTMAWGACARVLAADARLEVFAVEPAAAGWCVTSGPAGEPVAWTQAELGALVQAGHLVAVAGGTAVATRDAAGAVGIALTIPAAAPD